MSTWTAIVIIVAIVALTNMVRARHGGSRRLRRHESGQAQLPSPREQELEREVEDLRERIHVLERIATDGNSIDARETRRIAEEIEALRNQQGN